MADLENTGSIIPLLKQNMSLDYVAEFSLTVLIARNTAILFVLFHLKIFTVNSQFWPSRSAHLALIVH